ncbi:MAG: hypothetical protein ACFE0J_20105 [Elainellaceae cyanobacterium]
MTKQIPIASNYHLSRTTLFPDEDSHPTKLATPLKRKARFRRWKRLYRRLTRFDYRISLSWFGGLHIYSTESHHEHRQTSHS